MDNFQSISLTDLRFYAYHGVEPQERIVGAEYSVSLTIYTDISKACVSDSVEDTVNYADIATLVKQVMSVPQNLLEKVAHNIVCSLFSHYGTIKAATVTVTKKNPPVPVPCSAASVTISQNR
ncbi:MAG: dihydroneopterin aldolase [Bacteroidaceae bacterium]|nr:dihydroneopterin aldolase [Bacteroidaceae bacterium]